MTDNSDAKVSKLKEVWVLDDPAMMSSQWEDTYRPAYETDPKAHQSPKEKGHRFVNSDTFQRLLAHANELERVLNDYVDCQCSVHERLSGHKTDCGSLYIEESRENFRAFKKENGL